MRDLSFLRLIPMLFLCTVFGCSGGGNPSTSQQTTQPTQPDPIATTISWATPPALNYGIALNETQLNATANVPGNMAYSPEAGILLPAGTHILSVTFTPIDTAKYTTTTATVPLVVNKVPLTLISNNATSIYGQLPDGFTVSYVGFVNNDSATALSGTPKISTSANVQSPVGVYPMVISQGDLSAVNYTFTFLTGVLTVTPAQPIITWATPAPVTYGTPLSSAQLNAVGSTPGTFLYDPLPGTTVANTSVLSVAFTPTSVNYAVVSAHVSLIVNPVGDPKSIQGLWSVLPYSMPINPIHATLLNTGNILFLQGSGNCPPTLAGCPQSPADYPAALWNLSSGSIATLTGYTNWDMFCNGAISLADGRILIVGGTESYAGGTAAQVMAAMGHAQPASAPGHVTSAVETTPGHRPVSRNARSNDDSAFLGSDQSALFDPTVPFSAASFTNAASMHSTPERGRWYPTVIPLDDGRVMTFGGQDNIGNDNNTVEYYTPSAGTWSEEFAAVCSTSTDVTACDPNSTIGLNEWYPQLYPRMFQLPNGKIFYAGPEPQSSMYDPTTHLWSYAFTHTNYSDIRTYGAAVLLPLTPENNYNPVVMTMGGNNPATETTELIDLGVSNPMWVNGPLMSRARIEMQAVILPNAKLLIFAGSANDEDSSTASFTADIYDPTTNTLNQGGAGSTSVPRLYHNTALLLPDGTVMSAGSNPAQGVAEQRIEIYQPAYLFNTDGTLAVRPVVTGVPSQIVGTTQFTLQVPNAADVAHVTIVREGDNTHSFDMSQRAVGLSFSASSGQLTVAGPPSAYIAPPGYYMLFVVNSAGVPSVGQFVQVK